ncbi:NADH-quinone oxidoreductase subunit J [bacterium]|nr:NADH-quinone oxidoreductase subunit J [bacterium]
MNGIFNPIVFYPSAVLMILFAVLAIKFKNIFYSLLSAIVVFFLAGFLFYVLGAEYNAVIQIAIYGVAVPVILGLAVMFTDLKKEDKTTSNKNSFYKILLLIFSIIFVFSLLFVISPYTFDYNFSNSVNSYDVISIFGEKLFKKYVLAFEFVSILLTMIIVGLILIKKDSKDFESEELCKK